MNSMRLTRILEEMNMAAKLGEIYHLWWHPHNFGNDPDRSLRELDTLIDQYLRLKEKFGMDSLHMKGLGEKVLAKRASNNFPDLNQSVVR